VLRVYAYFDVVSRNGNFINYLLKKGNKKSETLGCFAFFSVDFLSSCLWFESDLSLGQKGGISSSGSTT